VNRLFVSKKAFAEHLMHALKAHTFDERVLLLDCYIYDPFGAKKGNEELSSKKEGGGVSVFVLKIE
jgi:hypothetical protein